MNNKPKKRKITKGIYCFFNFETNNSGLKVLSLCKKCAKKERVPNGCVLRQIAEKSLLPCRNCKN